MLLQAWASDKGGDGKNGFVEFQWPPRAYTFAGFDETVMDAPENQFAQARPGPLLLIFWASSTEFSDGARFQRANE